MTDGRPPLKSYLEAAVPEEPGRPQIFWERQRMSERVPMTKGGLERLKDELKRLKNVERPKIV